MHTGETPVPLIHIKIIFSYFVVLVATSMGDSCIQTSVGLRDEPDYLIRE